MSAAPPDPERAVPPERLRHLPSWLVNHLAGRANRLLASRLGNLGLRTDYAVLASLHDTGPASQAALGRRLAIDRSDMVAVLNRLAQQGLAVRQPDAHDRRRNEVSITPAGRGALAELEAHIEHAQADLLEPLSAGQRQQLVQLLQLLVDHHHARAQSPPAS